MTLRKATALVLVLVLGTLIGWTLSADAKKKRPSLRREVTLLKARIAELESRISFEARQPSAGGGADGQFPGAGGLCGDPCATDSDGDGSGDCEDPCPCDPSNTDTDGDGAADCWDSCPDDATDACIDPCRMDSDGDGTTDCEDPCAWDAMPPSDEDGDDIPTCADPCPNDPANECFEPCPLDADGDGMGDCTDPCPWGETGPCTLPPGVAPGSPGGVVR